MTNSATQKKKLFIKTYGCQMNVYDSEKMAELLEPHGYNITDNSDTADLVILNTCHIREKATEKVYSDIGRLKKAKDKRGNAGKGQIIAIGGCVAQAEGQEIINRAPVVDMVFGPQTYQDLPEMLAKLRSKEARRIVNTDFPADSKFDYLPEESRSGKISAFVSVQEGCDKFCHFCCVPYTRGTEYSRPVAQVLNDIKRLVAEGTREVHLLGQNVNAYHGEAEDGSTWGLARLIYAISDINGVERIRYITSHPRDMDAALIKAHGDVPQLMPYLHLPIQSGSDRILKTMNRKHTRDFYFKVIDDLKAARPDLAVSSDFIVGYPGETDQDFADTLDLVRRINFAQAYSFKYSPRPGTPAAIMENQVEETIKTERLEALQQLLDAQQLAYNHGFIGKTVPVLFERFGHKEGQLNGRSPWMQSVNVTGAERLLGKIIDVEIDLANERSLHGIIKVE
ncbi:MAG: tRNA (N6-isopentenyl adenosine(37)-C2)-methylthiotransferase MiaB [Alphaproteobacteria bacterium]|jgi:tRNA-2-methylthio-N6-dimethylallyladenosine synthase|nr:tRNA (N6-isopentenyl adenosine(37)-C2)-methylthiotransferase MiaB [Alphaproteobacteria bacterium]MBP9878141.1 tRNA (N6-isopentenyl adenosine(37)-C2)-methylthiotransferase MiaB [Alphaproteobacteria bacterium]